MAISERLGLTNLRLLACAALLAAATGGVAGMKPEYGIFLALGLAFTAAVIADLTVGFLAFTVLSFFDELSGSGSISATKAIGLILFVSWLVRVAIHRGEEIVGFITEHAKLLVSLAAMLGWAAISFAWAASPGTALGGAGQYALDMMLIPIAFAALREREHVKWALAAFAVGTVISSGYGLLVPTASTNALDAGRLTGTIGEANAAAILSAAGIPLVIALGAASRSSRAKLLALVGTVVLFMGLVNTLSREGLLALGAVLVGAVLLGGRWRGRAVALLVVGVVATLGYFFVLAPLTARNRVTATTTSGRSSLYTVAWRVFKTHPLLGVGNDNFPVVEKRYIEQPGVITSANVIVDTPFPAHDAALEALADLGVPGLATLLAVWGGCFVLAIRAARLFARVGDVELELLSRALALALIAIFVGDAFTPSQYAKYLWILLALCPVVMSMANREAGITHQRRRARRGTRARAAR